MAPDPELLRYLPGFTQEVDQIHQRCTQDLIALEQAAPEARPPLVTRIARGLHTIKGSAGTLGLAEAAKIAHALETLLAPAKKGGALPEKAGDLVLRGLDLVRELIRDAAGGGGGAGAQAAAELLSALEEPAQVAPAAPALDLVCEAPPPPTPSPAPAPAAETADIQMRVTTGQVAQFLRELERLRELRLGLEGRRREIDLDLSRREAQADAVRLRTSLQRLALCFTRHAEEAGDILESMESSLKAVSTLPIRVVVEPMQRSVRDLCKQLGKEARLSMVGGEISVDKGVLEALRGPLVHLVRNAVDHGLERPHVRERKGKHRAGLIVIRAAQHGNMLALEVSDDGAGIDAERVRAAALKQGTLSAPELQAMAPEAVLQLIFLPGLSTREQVTDISGRGVGLDVVMSEVRRLRGQVEVRSSRGGGTRFLLTLPIGYGSSPLLMVRCGELRAALPSVNVETLMRGRPELIQRTAGGTDLRYRDELVPLEDLGAVLGLREPLPPERSQPVMVVHAQGRRRAFLVDEIEGERDLLIRPLPPLLSGLPHYEGAITTADGG
ncbi:MAG TPA: ATP-binding protein, partial [Myxococcales bacterium]|nr:ATP-binding protein [Myxococcales bacterium]